MKLRHQLVALSIALSLLLITILGGLLALFMRYHLVAEVQGRGSELARLLAVDQQVIAVLDKQGDPLSLYHYIEQLRRQTTAAYIVITDLDARRLSHPSIERIGQQFQGDDIWLALKKQRSYCSMDKGTLGKAIRCFAPVISGDDQTVGVVVVGYLMQQFERIYKEQIMLLLAAIGMVLLAGLLLVIIGQRLLRKSLLDLEPETIAHRFRLQELILEQIAEGVVVINGSGHITMLNSSARYQLQLLSFGRHSLLGQSLAELVPSLSNKEIAQQDSFNFVIQGEPFAGRRIAVIGREPYDLLIFHHAEQATDLRVQMMHLNQYAQMLRMQSHEFSNKLSSLSGLLQLGHVDQAVELIQQESDTCQHLLQDVLNTIENKPIAGLLLGKFSRAQELGVKFELDPDSSLVDYPPLVCRDLITLMGNLVDNGLQAAWLNRQQTSPWVMLSICDVGRNLVIEVEDSGAGVDEVIAEHLFDYGVSRQCGDHGVGLFLVKEVVARRHGTIEWFRTDEQRTLFAIYLPKNQLI